LTGHPPSAEQHRELARLIRQSDVLDPMLKRQWLRVLPHLKPADQARLRTILAGEPPDRESLPLDGEGSGRG
jgi:hypothetical protein